MENKTLWEHLKAWVNGDEILIDADKYIAGRSEKKKLNYKYFISRDIFANNHKLYCIMCVSVSVLFIVTMLAVVSSLPSFGSADNPAVNEVMRRYIENGIEETGAINFVAGMILDYRAFDTFGESNVLFMAVMSVVLLLKKDKKNTYEWEERERAEDEEFISSEHKSILKVGARFLVPLIILYGIYVVLNGHLSPGGGFSGGSIIGAGLILYSAAYGSEKMKLFFTFKTFTRISVAGLLTYFICKSYSFFTGANHVGYEIPRGIPGNILSSGFILPLNICVGLIVACTMYGFYSLFTKGDI